MCETEIDRKYYLLGKAVSLADEAGCSAYCEELLTTAIGIPSLERIVQEMEARIEHKRQWQEEIAGWYRSMDRQGRNTGD